MRKKYFIVLASLVVLCLSLVGCGSGSNISGEWYSTDGQSSIIFNKDGSLTIDSVKAEYTEVGEGVYNIILKGNLESAGEYNDLKIKLDKDSTLSCEIDSDGNSLQIKDSINGVTYSYVSKGTLKGIVNKDYPKVKDGVKHKDVEFMANKLTVKTLDTESEIKFANKEDRALYEEYLVLNKNFDKAEDLISSDFIKYFEKYASKIYPGSEVELNFLYIGKSDKGDSFYCYDARVISGDYVMKSYTILIDKECKSLYINNSNTSYAEWEGVFKDLHLIKSTK